MVDNLKNIMDKLNYPLTTIDSFIIFKLLFKKIMRISQALISLNYNNLNSSNLNLKQNYSSIFFDFKVFYKLL